MLRHRKQLALGLLGASCLLATSGFGVVFALACAAPVEAYPHLAEAQRRLDPTRAVLSPSPEPDGSDSSFEAASGLGQLLRAVSYAVVSAFLGLKQTNAFAYPAHAMLAQTLELATCEKDSIRLQWLKAGLHASTPGQADRVALALQRSLAGEEDLAALRLTVEAMAEREYWSVGMRQVRAALARPT